MRVQPPSVLLRALHADCFCFSASACYAQGQTKEAQAEGILSIQPLTNRELWGE